MKRDFTTREYIEGFAKVATVITMLAFTAAVAPVEELPAFFIAVWDRVYLWLQALPAGILALVLFTPGITVAGLALAHGDKEKQQS